jgi:SpoVK/Ycf46/Vps4 family AAA+-type ATPase
MKLNNSDRNRVFEKKGLVNISSSETFQNNLNIIMDFIKKATNNIDKVNHVDIRLEFLDQLNKINLSVLNNREEINQVHYSNTKTSPYSIHDELINIDDHVII